MFADPTKRPGIWSRNHYLDRMTLKGLTVAYFQYYAIQAYLLLAVVSIAVAVWNPPGLLAGVAAVSYTHLDVYKRQHDP